MDGGCWEGSVIITIIEITVESLLKVLENASLNTDCFRYNVRWKSLFLFSMITPFRLWIITKSDIVPLQVNVNMIENINNWPNKQGFEVVGADNSIKKLEKHVCHTFKSFLNVLQAMKTSQKLWDKHFSSLRKKNENFHRAAAAEKTRIKTHMWTRESTFPSERTKIVCEEKFGKRRKKAAEENSHLNTSHGSSTEHRL